MNTRRGEEIRREGERGERGRRGGKGGRQGSRASICHTATGGRYMIGCAHFSILASVVWILQYTLPDLIADIQSGGLYDCFHQLFSLLSQEQVLVVKRGRGRIT